MKYLVFGSGGFLGKALVSFLRKSGDEVVATSRENNADYKVDISNEASFQSLMNVGPIDVIINCASILPNAAASINDASFLKKLLDTNVIGGLNILNFGASIGVAKIINCSSLSVVNKPWPVPLTEEAIAKPGGRHIGYSVSKLAQELVMSEAAEHLNVSLLHLRLSALYGAGMAPEGLLPMLLSKAATNKKIQLWNATKNSFDFLLVRDAVKIIFLLSKRAEWKSQVINVASGEEIFLDKLMELILMESNSLSPIENGVTDSPISRAVIDNNRLLSLLPQEWKMTPLKEGIKEMVTYYKSIKECAT